MNRFVFAALSLAVVSLAYCRFFAGTSFTQDDFVWLCFAKFHPAPLSVFWRDTLCLQFFRPMGQLWWVAVYRFAGDALWPYQIAFLLTHLVNGLLVGRLAAHFAGRVAGGLAGLFFVLSPLFVASLSGHYLFIFDVLGFFFFALSLVCVGSFVRTGRRLFAIVSLGAALGAFFSKESYFTLPIFVLLMLGMDDESRWSWSRVRPRLGWFALHAGMLLVAVAWRTSVIGGLGGYGLADLSSPSKILAHFGGRAITWMGFGGWTLVPFLARWSPSDGWPAVGSLLLLGGLTAASFGDRTRRRVALWSWFWMLVAWSPSMVMTTHAPVSWYPCTLGSSLLAALVVDRLTGRYVWGFTIALLLALSGLIDYSNKVPYIALLRDQQRKLREQFPTGGSSLPAGHRYFLLQSAFDLYPDPIVKLSAPRGEPMPDVMFFNASAPVGWVITNPRGHDVWPMRPAAMFQRPYMDMIDYYAMPLMLPQRDVLRRAGPRFHFLRWVNGSWVDITDQVRIEAEDRSKGNPSRSASGPTGR